MAFQKYIYSYEGARAAEAKSNTKSEMATYK